MESDPNASNAPLHRTGGPGPFVTHWVHRLPSGLHRVATSRRHRKGLSPYEVVDIADATAIPATRHGAFRHIWAPRRIGWWIAVLFAVGSILFMVGGLVASWPDASPAALRDPATLGLVFFVGSLFFTSAAWLQWLEALNADVATAADTAPRHWRWFGWCPRNLGYLACAVQLVGTLLFNFNTADAMITGLSWREQDVWVWTPNMLGSICFLVASMLAYVEVSHGAIAFAPRSVSWWITVVNLAGSIAFQLSAFFSYVGPAPASPAILFWSTFFTAAGAGCFLLGAYLLIPELFDTE
jgi:hypothetical protein